jgi:hypothetical protein
MNRIRTPALRADKFRTVRDVAGEFEALAIDQALFQTHSHQSAVVGNTIERAELVGAHFVTRGKMPSEMLIALATPRARQELTIEPCINFSDRMELTRINLRLSFSTNDGATRLIAAADALLPRSFRTADD